MELNHRTLKQHTKLSSLFLNKICILETNKYVSFILQCVPFSGYIILLDIIGNSIEGDLIVW